MSTIAPVPGPTPQVLGDYTLLSKLASGGMATVYVASKRGMAGFERLVAIKCCHPHLRETEDFLGMFLDEARLAARIRHPNVVATLDVGEDEYLYLVMEYIEGASLANLIREASKVGSTVPVEVAVRVMIDALSGLHAAHELRDADGSYLNLVHRDVSPHNILVGLDGVARITDFGVAFASARSTVTQDGRIKGKFSYIAPEQVRGQPATRRMDLFAAGTVLWEALVGRSLFRCAEDAATINAVLNREIPEPSSLNARVPRALDPIVLKALSRNPEERFATASEFAAALGRIMPRQATGNSVGAYVEKAFGEELSARRELIRRAPEQTTSLPSPSATPSRVQTRAPVQPDRTQPPEHRRSSRPPRSLPPGELEHRRMRAILAAAMLILVGSALGLLLARAGPSAGETPAPASTGTP